MIYEIIEEAYLIFYENSVFEMLFLEEDDARRKLMRMYPASDNGTIERYMTVVGKLRGSLETRNLH